VEVTQHSDLSRRSETKTDLSRRNEMKTDVEFAQDWNLTLQNTGFPMGLENDYLFDTFQFVVNIQ